VGKLIEPRFLAILNNFENDIDLLRNELGRDLNDAGGLFEQDDGNKVFKDKLELAQMLNRVISYTMHINFVNYYKFKKKCQDDGFSVQDGLNQLIENFIDDKLIIKSD